MEDEGATFQRYYRESHRRLRRGFRHNNGDESQAGDQTFGGQQSSRRPSDYLERAKREEEAPLIEAAYQKHLVDNEIFFQQLQQQGIEESRQRHVADVAQKNRLIRMLSDKNVFHNQVVSHREAEFERLKREREERVAEVRTIRKQEREMRRKMEYYRRQEAARLIKLKEEEEGRKREEEERKAKLDEIAEKQKQQERELEEKERLRREDLMKEEQIGSKAASQPTANKFVPRARPKAVESAGSTEADNERWRRGDRQSHVHAGRDGHPIPTLREADAPDQARYRYAPLSHKYERPPVVSGRLEPPRGGRDAQQGQGQGQGPPLGRYGQRPKYGGFGSGHTRDEHDRDRDRWEAGPEDSNILAALLRQSRFHKSWVTLHLKLKNLEEEIARLNLQRDARATSLIELDSEGGTAAEYLLVRDRTHRFFQPMHGNFPTVTKIEKIQSMKLQIKFLETESHLISHRSPTQLLFHRTSDDRIERILKRGFRLSPSNKTNIFGQGIYFAMESSSSAQQKAYTRGSNKLLLCEVLLGKTWTVQKPQPEMNKWIINRKGYDSLLSRRAGNEGGGPLYDEFVVYDCYQAIPRYIVHYNNHAMQPSQTLGDQNLTRIQYKMSPTFCGDSPAEYHFRLAESQFFRMTSSNLYKVVMVELIINKTLLRRYERAKEEFGGKKTSVEERLVFHGTRRDAIEKIIEEGFKMGGEGVEVQHGRSFGSGVYTALDPTISVQYSGPERMMLLSFALLGEAGKDYSHRDSPKVLVFKKVEYFQNM